MRNGAVYSETKFSKQKYVVLVEAPPIRRVLRDVLSHHPGWTVSGEADSFVQARYLIRTLRPDVVIVEPALFSELELRSFASLQEPGTSVLVYSWFRPGDDERARYIEAGYATAAKSDTIWCLVNGLTRLTLRSQATPLSAPFLER